MENAAPVTTPEKGESLFHVWFVKYNPVYLASAALVLGGLTLLVLDLAEGEALASLGISALAELYAFALIGGAALLFRIGQERAAIMLGLLAALYQCDVTLHVERAPYLGPWLGVLAATTWAALFHAKLRLLVMALRLRVSRVALALPTLGALAIALLPQTFRHLAPGARSSLVALVIFAVASLALFSSLRVESAIGWDVRGRRAWVGTWLLWAAGMGLHAAYWSQASGVSLQAFLPGAVLLVASRVFAGERLLWALAVLTPATAFLIDPDALPAVALMAAATLALRALREPADLEPAHGTTRGEPPYRARAEGAPTDAAHDLGPPEEARFGLGEVALRERLLLGAASFAHIALWQALAPGIAHVAALDGLLVCVAVVAYAVGRRPQAFALLVPLSLHLAASERVLVPPRTPGQLGGWAVATGFALLLAALATAWRKRRAS